MASATLLHGLFSIFFRIIHSFIYPFAEGPLLFPHCSPLSRGPPLGAEPGFKLGPAVQQDDALLSELRRTLSELRRTLSELRRSLSELRRTLSELRRSLSELRRTLYELRRSLPELRRTLSKLRRIIAY